MSGKINIFGIVTAHVRTLRHHGRNEISVLDITVFFIAPAFVAVTLFLNGDILSSELVGVMINAAAILLGLLLNLLVLMFDQRNRAQEALSKLSSPSISDPDGMRGKLQLRSDLISQTVANISFTVLLCIASLFSLLVYVAGNFCCSEFSWVGSFICAINVFIWISVPLTILMVIKRVFALFVQSA